MLAEVLGRGGLACVTVGPVERAALARLAASCFSEMGLGGVIGANRIQACESPFRAHVSQPRRLESEIERRRRLETEEIF